MELWLIVILFSNFLYGMVFVVDKFLLAKKLPSTVYAFMVALMGGALGLAIIPFVKTIPSLSTALVILFIDAAFILGLYFFYTALNKGAALRVAPLIGGLKPLIILLIAFVFLKESLTQMQLIAVFVLIAGGILIILPEKEKTKTKKFSFEITILASLAALFFAIHDSFLKIVYENMEFWQGFFWARMGFLLLVLLFFLKPGFYNLLKRTMERSKHKVSKTKGDHDISFSKAGLLFVVNQTVGAFAFILFNYAINLGKVSLVNAMQGLQYAFLFIFILILTRFKTFKKVFKKSVKKRTLIQKIIAIILIIIGVGLLTM